MVNSCAAKSMVVVTSTYWVSNLLDRESIFCTADREDSLQQEAFQEDRCLQEKYVFTCNVLINIHTSMIVRNGVRTSLAVLADIPLPSHGFP